MSFDSLPDRRVHGSFKWKRYPEDVIPLWVADMDFRTPECVTDALHKAVEHGIFGYTLPQKKLIGTIIDMLWKKYNWKVEASSIVWLPGLVSALNICCRAYTQKGQNIVTSTPIYPPFLEAPTLADRKLDTAELQLVNGKYEMDLGNSNLNLTAGYSYNQFNGSGNDFELGDFPDNSIDWSNAIGGSQDLLNAGFIGANSYASPDDKIVGMFARANFVINNRYFLNASLRREGSSRFGENVQFGKVC